MDLSYYGYLAQNVPARELARAVAVRARRALGLSQVRVERRAAGPRPALLPAPPQVLRARWPEHCAAVLEEASRAREGELLLFGQWKDCGKPIDYHRDPFAPAIRFDADAPAEAVDLFRPGADAKAAWEVGRLAHLWRFAQAYWLTGDAQWAREWLDGLRHFRAGSRAGFGVQWACAMEVSLRALNIALSSALLGAGLPEVIDCLEEHCFFVATHLEETGAVRTNHYAADLVGIVAVGALFPELRGYHELFAPRLWEEIPRQCRKDGTHFESSAGYQRLCAEMFAAAALATRAAGLSVPPAVEDAVRGLFRSLAEMLDARGSMPQLGDLDSCRALPLAPRAALDASFAADAQAPEWLWLGCGSEFAAQPCERSVMLPDAGVAVLRASDAWLFMSSGPNGQGGTGGHAHNDKNSVELTFGSLKVAVDRGTYVYARDPGERDARRGTASHSTVQVDGLEQNRIVPGRLFALPDTAAARVVRIEERDGFQMAVGEHEGYRRAGIVHRRTAALRSDAAVFIDELRGGGKHHFELRWFVPQVEVAQRPATAEEAARLQELERRGLTSAIDLQRCVAVAGGALLAFGATLPWTLSLQRTDVSPGYWEKRPAHCIAVTLSGKAPAQLFTVILKLPGRSADG